MTTMVDLLYDRPPLLYTTPGRPPLDAWDLQIAAPPPLVAWLEARRRRGQQDGIYGVGARAAITLVAEAFPQVALSSEHHVDAPQYPHPHVHVLLAPRGPDRRRLDPEQLEQVATEAWTTHVQRMIDYARGRPHLDLQWLPDGSIPGIDHRHIPPFTCTEFDWLDQDPVIPQV